MKEREGRKRTFADYFGVSDTALRLSSVGLALVFSTFIGFGLGWLLDKMLKTRPFLTILFLLLGIVAGFVNIYRSVKAEQEPDEEKEDEDVGNPKSNGGK